MADDNIDDEDDRPGGGRRLIDLRTTPTRAGLIVPDVRGASKAHELAMRKAEFEGLAGAIHLEIVFSDIVRVRDVRPATFIGAGAVAELRRRVSEGEVELLLFDGALAPVQQRNLETETGAKVLDRTALILEIFGERAATREGVLQVELAHLNYQKSRLVRSWTHLARQRGGFGCLGGPGETQIESDRRLLEERIRLLEQRLEKVKRTRSQQRSRREAAQLPVVALVGYTNAGKSSLFNRLTGAGVFAENLLFATLDTTIRKLELPHGRAVMLSDTVGFVADLPTTLVAAFRATLEEVTEADLILHVRDVANPDSAAQARDVLEVLGELGVSADATPIIEVWNKLDLLGATPEDRRQALQHVSPAGSVAATVAASAATGEGTADLLDVIERTLAARSGTFTVRIPHANGADAAWLYGHAEIIGKGEPDDESQTYEVRVDPRNRAAFTQRFAGRIEAA
jgi:GTP-binding protein HflX